jgi:hypothetical protein
MFIKSKLARIAARVCILGPLVFASLAASAAGLGTTSCIYRTSGAGSYRCFDSRITPASRVFASVSEYANSDPNQRFLGGAWMTVHNIIPQNGYVDVVIDTGWTAFPIFVRLDLLIDQ